MMGVAVGDDTVWGWLLVRSGVQIVIGNVYLRVIRSVGNYIN